MKKEEFYKAAIKEERPLKWKSRGHRLKAHQLMEWLAAWVPGQMKDLLEEKGFSVKFVSGRGSRTCPEWLEAEDRRNDTQASIRLASVYQDIAIDDRDAESMEFFLAMEDDDLREKHIKTVIAEHLTTVYIALTSKSNKEMKKRLKTRQGIMKSWFYKNPKGARKAAEKRMKKNKRR